MELYLLLFNLCKMSSSLCLKKKDYRENVNYYSSSIKLLVESKITKILNFDENSQLKVPNQMAKSKAQTHQPNG